MRVVKSRHVRDALLAERERLVQAAKDWEADANPYLRPSDHNEQWANRLKAERCWGEVAQIDQKLREMDG